MDDRRIEVHAEGPSYFLIMSTRTSHQPLLFGSGASFTNPSRLPALQDLGFPLCLDKPLEDSYRTYDPPRIYSAQSLKTVQDLGLLERRHAAAKIVQGILPVDVEFNSPSLLNIACTVNYIDILELVNEVCQGEAYKFDGTILLRVNPSLLKELSSRLSSLIYDNKLVDPATLKKARIHLPLWPQTVNWSDNSLEYDNIAREYWFLADFELVACFFREEVEHFLAAIYSCQQTFQQSHRQGFRSGRTPSSVEQAIARGEQRLRENQARIECLQIERLKTSPSQNSQADFAELQLDFNHQQHESPPVGMHIASKESRTFTPTVQPVESNFIATGSAHPQAPSVDTEGFITAQFHDLVTNPFREQRMTEVRETINSPISHVTPVITQPLPQSLPQDDRLLEIDQGAKGNFDRGFGNREPDGLRNDDSNNSRAGNHGNLRGSDGRTNIHLSPGNALSQVNFCPSQASEFYLDSRLKPDMIPEWDGNSDTLASWILRLNSFVRQSSTIRHQIGRIIPLRLKGSAAQWYYSLNVNERSDAERSWDSIREKIGSYFMSSAWIEQQRSQALRMKFREDNHRHETPSDYVIRKFELLSLCYNMDDSELILEVMNTAPSMWSSIIHTQYYATFSEFQSAIKYHEDILMEAYETGGSTWQSSRIDSRLEGSTSPDLNLNTDHSTHDDPDNALLSDELNEDF